MTRVLPAIAVILGLWSLWLILGGGVDFTIGVYRIRSNDPVRPLVVAVIAFVLYARVVGVAAIHRGLTAWFERIGDTRLALTIALGLTVLGIVLSPTAGVAADGYGYVSQADLWIRGDLKIPQPAISGVPWPEAPWTFSPLGYRPGPQQDVPALVPIYSAGLPMLMALAKFVGGQELMFWVVPVFGGLFAWITYGIGRRLGSSRAGVMAAWLVATSPAVLLMLFQPMSDVPVAAAWCTAIYFAIGNSKRDVALSGLASTLAILIRPNLSLIAAVLGLWWLARPTRSDLVLSWQARTGRAALYGACAVPGMILTAALYQYLYGSPFKSGYGDLTGYFAWDHVLPNVRLYLSWFFETHSRLMVVGFVALLLPIRSAWAWVTDRSALLMILACLAVIVIQYLSYLVFDGWLYLRFMLTCWPFVMLGVATVALRAVSSSKPLVALLASAMIFILGIQGLQHPRTADLFREWLAQRRSVEFARVVAREFPQRSVFFTLDHSGTLRYYAGLTTIRTDYFDPAWFDRGVAWLKSQGFSAYLILEDWEWDRFTKRYAGQALTASLNERLTLVYAEANPYKVYDLTTATPVASRLVPVGDLHSLRSVPPDPAAFAPQLIPR